MREMPLTEGRSVDDEVQWLDEDRVLYALPEDAGEATGLDIEVLPVDGSASPARPGSRGVGGGRAFVTECPRWARVAANGRSWGVV